MHASTQALKPFRLPTGELDFTKTTLGERQFLDSLFLGREIASFTLSLIVVMLTLWILAG